MVDGETVDVEWVGDCVDSIVVGGYVDCSVGDCVAGNTVSSKVRLGAKVGAGVFIMMVVVVLSRANPPKAKHTKMALSKHTLAYMPPMRTRRYQGRG